MENKDGAIRSRSIQTIPGFFLSTNVMFSQFHMILNVAVGGVNGFFPDGAQYRAGKPWSNTSPQAATDFWNGRNSWLPSWKMSNKRNVDRALIVDYVRVYAL